MFYSCGIIVGIESSTEKESVKLHIEADVIDCQVCPVVFSQMDLRHLEK
jgi:hypothetical protein